jgi:hypothetical protein
VSDEEFTFDALEIPDGAEVYDRIAGLTYRYEAPLAQKVKEQQSVLDGNDSTSPTTHGQTNTDSLWSRVIMIACVAVLIGIIALLGYKYTITRAW